MSNTQIPCTPTQTGILKRQQFGDTKPGTLLKQHPNWADEYEDND
ncbi:hypothetical protein [Methylobacter tundripaludum]|nr:hypothetical protein [Methylobacter tundripaludum]